MKSKFMFNKLWFLGFLFLMFALVLVSCDKKDEPSQEQDPQNEKDPEPEPGFVPDPNWEYTNESWVYTGEPKEKDLQNAKVYFHYHRDKSDYDNWNIWVWQVDGVRYEGDGFDKFGKYYIVDLSIEDLDSYHAPMLGYIYHRGNWAEKDIEADRFITFTENMLNEGNEIHIFATQGNTNMYLDYELKNMVCEVTAFTLSKKLTSAEISCNCKAAGYKVYENDTVIKEGKPVNASFTIAMPSTCDFINNSYKVVVDFGTGGTLEKELNFNAYFDSTKFAEEYTYEGDDLGVTLNGNKTKFRLWAPVSSEVSVQLFHYGHPTSMATAQYPGENEPALSYNLTKDVNGTWVYEADQNLAGWYYTYTVKNGSVVTKDIVDPYAKAAGLNGLRGYIADFNSINPTGWSYDYARPYSLTELVVYELHVRDLTMDDTWTGTESNRGKYLGMAEAGTTYTSGDVTVKTGFDHIKELGVNAVQILPFFDQSNDERKDEFNWGYNPQNYNVLEGQYASNPYDAEARIREFKQMVMAYQEAGIEIIMDVVYNHMNSISNSSFHKIVPGYFFRYNTDGSASNGSGCGNETASERSMMRKYMVDSTKFWVQEYNISGFRFDLMGLHDTDTMNLIAAELKKIDNNICIWGEPWTGGTSPLDAAKQSVTTNGRALKDVSFFNDLIRDKIKGSVFDQNEGYWLQGVVDQISFGASLIGVGLNTTKTNYNPGKLLNYVSCHDNNTLRDKLILTGVSEEDLANADVVANSLVLLSEGVPFILSGEEFLRSKPVYENGEFVEYSHNSYNLPDEVNSLKWDEKIQNINTFNLYCQLIKLNREHPVFQINNFPTATSVYEIVDQDTGAIVVKLNCSGMTGEAWKSAYLVFTNASIESYTLELTEAYKVGFVSGADYELGQEVNSITVGKYNVVVVYQAN